MLKSPLDLFKGRKLLIATMHQKEQVIAPLLEKYLGVETIVPKEFNTDQFGTFTREIRRVGDQLETARKKAQTAIDKFGIDLIVSSEGSFDAHPAIPFVQSNFELVLLMDKKHNLEIKGHHRTSDTNINGRYVMNAEEALTFAKEIGFPEHGIILRKDENKNTDIYKNIQTQEELVSKTNQILSGFFNKRAFIETDMRAHKNPTRMKAIEKATENLIDNIFSICPKCFMPGFIAVNFEKGLKCSLCSSPTSLPESDIYVCDKCRFTEKRKTIKYGNFADPKYCINCNP